MSPKKEKWGGGAKEKKIQTFCESTSFAFVGS